MEEKNFITLTKNFDNAYEDIIDYVFNLLVKNNLTKYEFKEPLDLFKYNISKTLKVKSIEFICHKPIFIERCLDDMLIFITEDNNKLTLNDAIFKHSVDIFTILDLLIQEFAYFENINQENQPKIHIENKTIIITDPCYVIKKEKQKITDDDIIIKTSDNNGYDDLIVYKNSPKYKDIVKENGWEAIDLTLEQAYCIRKNYRDHQRALEEYKNKIKEEELYNDWEKSCYGLDLSAIGLNGITRSTIYGDWSCTTFNTDTKEPIGRFCADAGMVGVFILDEILEYNPDFKEYLEKDWTTTVIENFTGDIWFEVHHHEGIYEDDTSWHKKGEKWEDDSVHVVGKGNINFITEQTGF